ncbi:MAG TPA: flagellar FlbD family protein [Terriglobales bacterium]|nr:flagellar FlbD family protein [Terriglobales bacterium]
MSAFVRVTEAERSKDVFINPALVRSVQEIPGGSQITFADGKTLVVKDPVSIVVTALQGAK